MRSVERVNGTTHVSPKFPKFGGLTSKEKVILFLQNRRIVWPSMPLASLKMPAKTLRFEM